MAPFGILLVYLLLALAYLDRPGLQYDEALQAPAALRLLHPELPKEISGASTVGVAGRDWPVMTNAYIGAPKSYLLAGSFLLVGPGVLGLRLVGIGFGAAAILLTYLFARRSLGTFAALVAAGALATDPTFVLMTRADWGPVALATFFRCAALYAWLRWLRRREPAALIAGGLALGLGLYDKANFAWFVTALAIVGPVAMLAARVRPTARELRLACGAFFAGSFPFWIWNVARGWPTLRVAVEGNLPRLPSAPPWSALLDALPSRLDLLGMLLAGRGLDEYMFGASVEPWLDRPDFGSWADPSTLLVPILVLSAGLVGLCAALPGCRPVRWGRLLFPAAMTGLVLVQMLGTPLALWLHHLVFIYPQPQLFVGAALGEAVATARAGPRPIVAATAGLLGLALVGSNLLMMQRYHRLMADSGGLGNWSPAIYTLAEVLRSEYADRTVQVLDWGTSHQVLVLTGGQVTARELWLGLGASDGVATARGALNDPRNVFVLREAGTENFPGPGDTFRQAVRESGHAPCEQRLISEGDGRPLYRVISFRDCR